MPLKEYKASVKTKLVHYSLLEQTREKYGRFYIKEDGVWVAAGIKYMKYKACQDNS